MKLTNYGIELFKEIRRLIKDYPYALRLHPEAMFHIQNLLASEGSQTEFTWIRERLREWSQTTYTPEFIINTATISHLRKHAGIIIRFKKIESEIANTELEKIFEDLGGLPCTS